MSRIFQKFSFVLLTLVVITGSSRESKATIIYDTATAAAWRSPSVVYGSDGYILPAFDIVPTNPTNVVSLPSYISSYSLSGSLFNSTANNTGLIQDPRNPAVTGAGILYGSSTSITLTPNVDGSFKLALYVGGYSTFMNGLISFSGTSNTIADQQVGFWGTGYDPGTWPQATNTTAFPDGVANSAVWIQYDVSAIANQNIVISFSGTYPQTAALAFDNFAPVPEASTLSMLLIGGLFAFCFARHRQS